MSFSSIIQVQRLVALRTDEEPLIRVPCVKYQLMTKNRRQGSRTGLVGGQSLELRTLVKLICTSLGTAVKATNGPYNDAVILLLLVREMSHKKKMNSKVVSFGIMKRLLIDILVLHGSTSLQELNVADANLTATPVISNTLLIFNLAPPQRSRERNSWS